MMRIAYVCADPGVPIFGCKGSSAHAQGVLGALVRAGFDVMLFATRLGGAAPAALSHIPIVPLPRPAAEDHDQREVELINANGALRDALADYGPFDLIYERCSLWSSAAMEHARAMNTAGVLEVNALLTEEQAQHRVLIRAGMARHIQLQAFTAADAIIAVSQGVAQRVALAGVDACKIRAIPNGVDPTRFADAVEPTRRSADEPVTIGFIGTLKPWHDVESLIIAFAQIAHRGRRARLLIVGDGPRRPAYERMVNELGLSDRVTFTGALLPCEIPAALTSMDIAVAPYPPTKDDYFSPIKLFEYMAAARPIVASRVGQIADIIESGQTGLLAGPGSSDNLALQIQRLINDSALARRLGDAARAQALRRHTWDAVAGRILAIGATIGRRPTSARAMAS